MKRKKGKIGKHFDLFKKNSAFKPVLSVTQPSIFSLPFENKRMFFFFVGPIHGSHPNLYSRVSSFAHAHPSRRCPSPATALSNSGGCVASLEISPSKVWLRPIASHPSPLTPLSFKLAITQINRSECTNVWISKSFLSLIITLVKFVHLKESTVFFSFLLCCFSFLFLIVKCLFDSESIVVLPEQVCNFFSLLMIMMMNKCVQEKE